MKDIFQLIVAVPGNERIFFTQRDENRLLDYAKIYKERFEMDILAYCLKPTSAQFLFYDGCKKKELFAHNLKEAYGYYLELLLGEEVRLASKLYPVDSLDKYMNTMKLFHREGRNSLERYQKFSRYVNDDLLSIPLVLNTYQHSHQGDQKGFLKELVSEPSEDYALLFRKVQIFKRDKLSKRRERAKDFMYDFLEDQGISREILLGEEDHEMKKLLIKKFREETDLSFRDIGYVLGVSHTTVIRLHQESE